MPYSIHPAEPLLPNKFVIRDERGNVVRNGGNPIVFETRAEAEAALREMEGEIAPPARNPGSTGEFGESR